MLYFGQWKSMFAWHIEDVNLFSINYVHYGAPKQWYGIAPRDADKFDEVCRQLWPLESRGCRDFIRHKEFLVSPALLRSRGVRTISTRQMRGEFMITWPRAYHAGFNYGFNAAESVNFAAETWFAATKQCSRCTCRMDSVWLAPAELRARLRQLQWLSRQERKRAGTSAAEPLSDSPSKKRTRAAAATDAPSTLLDNASDSSQELSVADVPSDYVLDAASIWLDLPTDPRELQRLRDRFFPPKDADSLAPTRSMASRRMGSAMAPSTAEDVGGRSSRAARQRGSAAAAAGASEDVASDSDAGSNEDGFLFDQRAYNDQGTAEQQDRAGYCDDANALICSYQDCTEPLHANQKALMQHYARAHSQAARDKIDQASKGSSGVGAFSTAAVRSTPTDSKKRKSLSPAARLATKTAASPHKKKLR
jgi:hypothetical protein